MGAVNRSRFAQLHSQNEQESVTQQAREARHFLQAVAVCKDSFTQANTDMVASPTAAVIQGRSVFSAACRQGWPHLRHPSGWYSGALVVFWPAVIDIRSPSIQSDSLLQLRLILCKLVELAVECPQIYTSSFHIQVQLCRMEKVLDWSSIECPLSRAPLDKPDGVEPTKPRGA